VALADDINALPIAPVAGTGNHPADHATIDAALKSFQTTLVVKADLVGGKIPTSQIDPRSTHEIVAVVDRNAMLALTTAQVQTGDEAVIGSTAVAADRGRWLLTGTNPGLITEWTQQPFSAGIQTINTQGGPVVTLGAADVGAPTIAALTTETSRATAAEGTNNTNTSNEVTRATNAETTLTTNLNNEVTRATNADNTNATNITNETNRATAAENTKATTTALTNETNRATTAENTLTTNITNETKRALAAEAATPVLAMGVKVNGLISPIGSYGESSTGQSYVLGKMYFAPFVFPKSITIDQASYCFYSGSVGARLALWGPDTYGLPSTLLADLGLATGSTPGLTTAAPVVVPVGLVWASIVLTAANASIYSMNNSFITSPGTSPATTTMFNTGNYSQFLSTTESTYTGTPPATLTTPPVTSIYTNAAGSTPTILLRRSA
jgi:hypothetical protein